MISRWEEGIIEVDEVGIGLAFGVCPFEQFKIVRRARQSERIGKNDW